MKKYKFLILMIIAVSILALGCTKEEMPKNPGAEKPPTTNPSVTVNPDAVTSASQAPDEESFEQKISKDGNFIIITSKDLTFTKDLTVEGTFPNRSLALAQYGENNEVIRHTLTVPRIVINSENTLLEYGTIKGDVYVQQAGFTTKDATIDGNLYFKTQELMDAFKADETTKISGDIKVEEYK